MFEFSYLNKDQKSEYLPILFDILYSNMQEIVPDEFDKNEFIKEVGGALEKSPRQIILCHCNGELAGFLMFYTRDNLIMIEELQLAKKYQMTRAFYLLCKFMAEILPYNIEFIEAYTHKNNGNSLSLQKSLGLEIVDVQNDKLFHLRGNVNSLKNQIR